MDHPLAPPLALSFLTMSALLSSTLKYLIPSFSHSVSNRTSSFSSRASSAFSHQPPPFLPTAESASTSSPLTSPSVRRNEHLAVLLSKHLWKVSQFSPRGCPYFQPDVSCPQPDSQASYCDVFNCRKPFTLFDRRHVRHSISHSNSIFSSRSIISTAESVVVSSALIAAPTRSHSSTLPISPLSIRLVVFPSLHSNLLPHQSFKPEFA